MQHLHDSIEEVRIFDEEIVLSLSRPLTSREVQRLKVDFDGLIERTVKSFAKVRVRTLYDHTKDPAYNHDPMPLLRDSRQAVEACRGTFMLRGDLLNVVQQLDKFFRNYALELGAEEQFYPVTVPVSSMIDNGYLSNFPHHALIAGRVHSDLEMLTEVAHKKAGAALPAGSIGNHDQMLAPTVCYHCFEAMRGQHIDLTGSLFTATNQCHRHEGAVTTGLARLQTFTMREVIFFGTPDSVVEKQMMILNDSRDVFESWGLSFKIMTATDPFFAVGSENKRAFQALQALKYELRIDMPFNNSSLAVASFNNHKNTLVKPYGISGAQERLASGCVGWGFERIAYGMFAQFGPDIADWPAPLRGVLEIDA